MRSTFISLVIHWDFSYPAGWLAADQGTAGYCLLVAAAAAPRGRMLASRTYMGSRT
jgi:hypothetical protein